MSAIINTNAEKINMGKYKLVMDAMKREPRKIEGGLRHKAQLAQLQSPFENQISPFKTFRKSIKL